MEAKQVSLILLTSDSRYGVGNILCLTAKLVHSIEYVIPSHFYVFLHVPLHFISLFLFYMSVEQHRRFKGLSHFHSIS